MHTVILELTPGKRYHYLTVHQNKAEIYCDVCEGTGKLYTKSKEERDCYNCVGGIFLGKEPYCWIVSDRAIELKSVEVYPRGKKVYHFSESIPLNGSSIQSGATNYGYSVLSGMFLAEERDEADAECERRNLKLAESRAVDD